MGLAAQLPLSPPSYALRLPFVGNVMTIATGWGTVRSLNCESLESLEVPTWSWLRKRAPNWTQCFADRKSGREWQASTKSSAPGNGTTARSRRHISIILQLRLTGSPPHRAAIGTIPANSGRTAACRCVGLPIPNQHTPRKLLGTLQIHRISRLPQRTADIC